jgi:hypothetical protein
MSLSVTPPLWPRRIAANGCSQALAELSTKPHVEGLNFPEHLDASRCCLTLLGKRIGHELFLNVAIGEK